MNIALNTYYNPYLDEILESISREKNLIKICLQVLNKTNNNLNHEKLDSYYFPPKKTLLGKLFKRYFK